MPRLFNLSQEAIQSEFLPLVTPNNPKAADYLFKDARVTPSVAFHLRIENNCV